MQEMRKNDSKAESPILEIAAGCSIAGLVVVAAVWLILETYYFLNYFSDPEAGGQNLSALFYGHLTVTVLCAVIGGPLLVIWVLCVKSIKRRERNTKNSHPGALGPQFRAPQESWGQRQVVSKAGSPFLGIAGALSCGGAVFVGFFWLFAMGMCFRAILRDPVRGFGEMGLTAVTMTTAICAYIEIPLLAVWGIWVDRRHTQVQNRIHSKPGSSLLSLAKVLSCCCLGAAAFVILRELLWHFGIISPGLFKAVVMNTALPLIIISTLAVVAVPVLFIRNIYAHIKWRKDQNGR